MLIARTSYHVYLAILLCSMGLASQVAAGPPAPITSDVIYERVINLKGQDGKTITLFVKLPPGAKTGADVKGVFAFCSGKENPPHIRNVLLGKAPPGVLVDVAKFASSHQMALVAWTAFSSRNTYDMTKNFDPDVADEASTPSGNFDQVATDWRQGIDGLIKEYQLPKNGWFLYGISRGAQWAHRLALREPDLFSAIHFHISSSFDKPVPEAAKIFWLVTTGELESGYPFSKSFYAAAQALKYPIIYKAEAKLGHKDSTAINQLSSAFFNYAWDRLHGGNTGNERFVGNYETHEYVNIKEFARIPEKLRVYLPTKSLAEAWGEQADPVSQ